MSGDAKVTSEVTPRYPTITQVEKNLWRLEKPVSHTLDGFTPFEVPTGTKTDGASVPRMFWNICPPMSTYTNAAVLHDYLYMRARDVRHDGDDPNGHAFLFGYSREKADRLFLAAMEFLGVARWRRRVMFRAVRMFGPRW